MAKKKPIEVPSSKIEIPTSNQNKTMKRGRKKANSLWRRKRSLFKKALELSRGCDRQVYICVKDKKFGGLTEFSDPSDLDLRKI